MLCQKKTLILNLFYQLCPALEPLEKGVVSNGDRWQEVADRNSQDDDEEEDEEEDEDEKDEEENGGEEEERSQADSTSPERTKAARNL